MLLAAPSFFAQPSHTALLSLATQELSPTKIRQSIADLVGQNQMEEANTLSFEALKRFPKSEDILVIRALVCQIRQDWPAASAARKGGEPMAHPPNAARRLASACAAGSPSTNRRR